MAEQNNNGEESKNLSETLKKRFEEHPERHPGITWDETKKKMSSQDLKTIGWMEQTGGEPDAVLYDGRICYMDFSDETPSGRRKVCYDENARLSRKKNAPESSAEEIAHLHGAKLLNEQEYEFLQNRKRVDQKTSSWIETPEEIRRQGGALFGDSRYGRTFIEPTRLTA